MKTVALSNCWLISWLIIVAVLSLVLTSGCTRKDDLGDAASVDLMPRREPPKSAPPSGYEFETPVRLTAGDEIISVEPPGYACPTMADVDEDGKLDLVVGQFNNGHMKFFKNIAKSGETPKFAAAQWIKSGDDRARVPGVW